MISDGRVIEEGRHEELYNDGGVYRELVDLQAIDESSGSTSSDSSEKLPGALGWLGLAWVGLGWLGFW